MRRHPVKIEPGTWVRWRPGTLSEECAVVLRVESDCAEIQRQYQIETEKVALGYLKFHWRVMRPTYQNSREAALARAGKSPLPEWVAVGERFCRIFDAVSVYEIIEVRGMWLLAREVVTGAPLFLRASKLMRFRPIQTRFQRVQ